ncbi:ribonucleoside-diphosphate reductase large subunit-like isoform X3 [Asparagus officinalis]|nr:ribonucleoside-diphosphate reductase large subunit-like isoform X3 [Asparagus officinalis]
MGSRARVLTILPCPSSRLLQIGSSLLSLSLSPPSDPKGYGFHRSPSNLVVDSSLEARRPTNLVVDSSLEARRRVLLQARRPLKFVVPRRSSFTLSTVFPPSEIIYNRDFYYDYFVFKVLERSCLLKVDGVVIERPQHMLMRASIGTHKSDIVSVIRTYQLMSERSYTLVNNVLFCAGTDWAQFSNCYIFCLEGDTVEGIYDTFKQCDHVIKSAGGIDDTVQKIGSLSRTHGMSNGIIPMLRLYTLTQLIMLIQRKSRGSREEVERKVAVSLEPWHSNILEFLDLEDNCLKARVLNRNIFEVLYYSALEASSVIAEKEQVLSFEESHMSKKKLLEQSNTTLQKCSYSENPWRDAHVMLLSALDRTNVSSIGINW